MFKPTVGLIFEGSNLKEREKKKWGGGGGLIFEGSNLKEREKKKWRGGRGGG